MINTNSSHESYAGKRVNFITYRNMVAKLIRNGKKSYFHNYFDKHKNSCIKTWAKINEFIKPKGSEQVTSFTHEGSTINNPLDIANKFNKFFSEIGLKLANEIRGPTCDNYTNYLSPYRGERFGFKHVNSQDISSIISNLKSKNSFGSDSLSVNILKKIKEPLLGVLTHLINLAFDTGSFPDMLKIAKVVPIFKKNDPSSFDNYRPISMLTSISKVFERAISNQLVDHFDHNKLFYTSQHGFRGRHSTETATLELTNNIIKDLDSNNNPACVYMDLSKAFDTINHNILLGKLKNYGLDDISLQLMTSYLSLRKQYVTFNSVCSTTLDISTGVPQGSILGPILFIVYMNDLPNCSSFFHPVIYADDTTLYFTLDKNSSPTEFSNLVNQELDKMY